jgi:membrane-bound hydrogenase subunit beta
VNTAESIVRSLEERYPVLEGKANVQSPRRIFLSVPLENLMDCLRYCFDALGMTHLVTITGLDNGEEFEFLYHIACDGGVVLTLKVKTPRDGGELPSVMPVYNGAIFYELELQGLLGVAVEGLPADRQYPLPDNWPKGQFPMRKDWKPNAETPTHPAL